MGIKPPLIFTKACSSLPAFAGSDESSGYLLAGTVRPNDSANKSASNIGAEVGGINAFCQKLALPIDFVKGLHLTAVKCERKRNLVGGFQRGGIDQSIFRRSLAAIEGYLTFAFMLGDADKHQVLVVLYGGQTCSVTFCCGSERYRGGDFRDVVLLTSADEGGHCGKIAEAAVTSQVQITAFHLIKGLLGVANTHPAQSE